MTFAVSTAGVAEIQPNPEVMEKWATALESGEYQQTTGTLQRTQESWNGAPVGFCCLGVLCDLAVKEGVLSVLAIQDNGTVAYDNNGYGEGGELPRAVMDWAGLSSANPEVDYPLTDEEVMDAFLYQYDFENIEDIPRTDQETLAELNDERGRDFSDIAQIIRDNYLS